MVLTGWYWDSDRDNWYNGEQSYAEGGPYRNDSPVEHIAEMAKNYVLDKSLVNTFHKSLQIRVMVI